MNHPFKQLINGKWVDARNGHTWEVKNPATEETITTVPFGDEKDAVAAIDAALEGFKIWSRTNPFDRAVILKRASTLMHNRLEDFAKYTVMESGKPIAEAVGEWRVAANYFEWYAEEGKRSYGK